MKQDERLVQHHETSETRRVLLAGFLGEEADNITAALTQMGWTSTALSRDAEIEAVFAAQRFDVTVIDAEHIEVFAPHFIARLRGTQGPSSDATILAIDDSGSASFQDQLVQSGADLVVNKPSDPQLYMANSTRVGTCRLPNIGTARTAFAEISAG